jgi:hypothetical protein
MMNRKTYVVSKETPRTCHLGRVWRKKYEKRVKNRCGVGRTDESRKWDEDLTHLRGEVKGNGDPHG